MITFLIIFFSLLLLLLCYIFTAPFYLEINTDTGLYRIRFHKVISAGLTMKNYSPILEIKLFGYTKQVELLRQKKDISHPKIKAGKKKKTKFPLKKVIAVLKSFKINTCIVSIDTGDNQLNGILYPVFSYLSWKNGKNIQINFLSENKIVFETQNNLARMSWAYIRS